MKKLLCFLPLLLCFFLLGCGTGKTFSNYRELHQTQLIQTMGLDKNGSEVSVTVASAATKEREAAAFTGKADTIIHALSNIHSYPSKQFLFYGHTGNLLIGSDMLNDLSDCLDFIERSVDMRLDTALFLVRGNTAEEVIRQAKVGEDSVTELLQPLSNESDLGSLNHMFTAKEIIGSLTSEGVGLAFAVKLSEDEGITKEGEVNIIPDGYAVIKERKVVGFIEEEDCMGVNLLLGLDVNQIVEVPDPLGGQVSLSLITTDCKFKPVWNNGELQSFVFSISAKSNIEQVHDELDIGDPKVIAQLEEELTNYLCTAADRAVELSRQTSTDFLGMRKQTEVANPIKYSRVKDRWQELFYTVPVDFQCDAVIERTYDIIKASEGNK